MLYTRFFMGAVREIGADLRNALAARLQSLSIGFHSRANSAIVQTKVVRDVENVEVMLQQTTHPLLSATMVLIGAIVMTAINVPAFLPVYALAIPLAVLLRAILNRRSARAQRDLPPRGRAVLRARRRDGHAHAHHPRARPRADRGHAASPAAPRACAAPASTSTCSTAGSRRCRG